MTCVTMAEAFEMAREEIWAFHKNHGFPSNLVNNVTNEVLKECSLDEKGHGYDDHTRPFIELVWPYEGV